ncbi:cardiolipin synthase [Salinibacillus kushneri]|uniref:cardiolipin synthase n=1 Tax=Salinibacillus kushneri TaxID=237682 RepID=UPI001C65B49A|nr:cardiolipin synthase [Salinibacillus kushneri]
MIIFFIWLDFYLGRKHHLQHTQSITFPLSSAQVQLFQSGHSLYDDMFRMIQHAKREVNVQIYIVRRDEISQTFLELLENKAREGLTVRLLVDRLGSYRINRSIRGQLREAGVQFGFSSKPGFPFLLYRLNRRNHRKIAVIDGEVAYTGGFNIGQEYINQDAHFNNWRDYHLKLYGPVAQNLQQVFKMDWEEAIEKIEVYHPDLKDENQKVKIMATDGCDIESTFLQFIKGAQQEIIMGSPYFIPSKTLMSAVKHALEKGVAVKILVPMKADHPLVKEGGIPYLFELKKAGADVRLFDQGFYHGKLLLVDDEWCEIGTANFDRRSLFLNKEVYAILYDKSFIEFVRRFFMQDFKASIVLSETWYKQLSWITRGVKIPLARLMRRWL